MMTSISSISLLMAKAEVQYYIRKIQNKFFIPTFDQLQMVNKTIMPMKVHNGQLPMMKMEMTETGIQTNH